jgi:iron complex outermembrane receptor protein
VQSGVWSAEPPGIAPFQAMTGLTYSAPQVPGLSFDGQINHASSRRLRSQGDLRSAAQTTMDIGLRYAFAVADRNLTLRARVLNLFDNDAWIATRSELLDRPSRRGARIGLTLSF